MLERREFLLALTAAGILPAAVPSRARAAAEPLNAALVFSGGGARGAYEAGIVGALAAVAAVSDGKALPPYDLVCGASIGALNGWFLATAQYTKLRQLWYSISAQDVIQLKPEYAALRDPESGLLNRAAAAVRLFGLTRDRVGILQTEPVYEWISRNVDPELPLAMPLIWSVTNLTHQRPEYFFLDPQARDAEFREQVRSALQISLGPQTIVREATPEVLHKALLASAAIPLAFDPVMLPNPDGELDAYCDGGVASNSPVGVAHSIARAADVILLNPPFEPEENYDDAVAVAFGAFGTMQRKMLEVEMRNAYFQSMGKRALGRLAPSELTRLTSGSEVLSQYVESVPETTLRYLRPATSLPVSVVGFDDAVGITQSYRRGWEDVAAGFAVYDWRTFVL